MTNAEGDSPSRATVRPQPEVEIGNSFRLRPERPRVSRLSRKTLIGGTALALTLISGAVFWALQTQSEAGARPGRTLLYRSPQRGRRTLRPAKRLRRNSLGRCRDSDRLCLVILVVRLSRHRPNPVRLRPTPSSSGSIRRLKQPAPARYLPIPLPVHCLVRRRPTRCPQAERRHPTKRLPRMVRIANLRSLTPRSIDEPPVLTDWRSLLRLSWSRLGP